MLKPKIRMTSAKHGEQSKRLDRRNKMEELKPCPFCGGKAVKIVYWDEEEQNEKVWEHGVKQDENHYYVIHCYDCDIELFGGVPISGEELIKAWNRRAENE
jgi:Lar family restriction alleviation protein